MLPTETWREHVARRQRYEEVRAKLAAGEVTSISDVVTYNLDIEKFAQDVIAGSEGPELVRAFWKALRAVSILDPTCGSGAFLFAALNILEPLYNACLDAMRGFLDDLERSGRKHRPEKFSGLRLAGRGEKIHEMVCRCGGRVPIREVCRARSTTATIRTDLGVSGTLGTCGASNASNETRRS